MKNKKIIALSTKTQSVTCFNLLDFLAECDFILEDYNFIITTPSLFSHC